MHVRRRRNEERGASLVEFALILPVLACLVFGGITGGLALSTKNSATNAVREGGRLGATLPVGASWAQDVRERVVDLAGGDLVDDEVCVQLIDVDSSTSPPTEVEVDSVIGTDCTGLAPATPSSADGCTVKVWSRTTAELTAIFVSRDLTIDASAVGIYERDGCP